MKYIHLVALLILVALMAACGSDDGSSSEVVVVTPTTDPASVVEPSPVIITATPDPAAEDTVDDAAADDSAADDSAADDSAAEAPADDGGGDAAAGDVPTVTANSGWARQIENKAGLEFALVPPGCFEMGSVDAFARFVEAPIATICFDAPFWIMVNEVANEDIEVNNFKIAGDQAWADDDYPRANVTWSEAKSFCETIGGRLPTEAEWEYSARGPDGLRWPFGDTFLPGFVIHAANSTSPIEVGTYTENASWVGANDMAGNVREWTSSLWKDYPYEKDDGREGAASGDMVLRGGSYQIGQDNTRSSFREFNLSAGISADIGFRCAMDY